MKTLKQLQEGVIMSSDYKLSKSGKRYKAHRKLVETSNPYADILEAMGYEAENKKRLKQIAATAKNAQTKSSEAKPLQFTEDIEQVDEARGRPKKMSMRSHEGGEGDNEEHEEHENDNGMEADQHIHVQLKKAADSDQKPFHVTFKNGKKHPVAQNVAKTILSATDRLKPEHRKNVHDEIHKSHDSLMAVHKMIAGK